jgi:hypothetical protein
LKLKCDEPVTKFAFKSNLRRYNMEKDGAHRHRAAGPYGKPLLRK